MHLPRSTFIIAFFTFTSRVTGLLRDIIFARTLGGGILADMFFIANKLPNTFRRIFAEGAMTSAFVPIFSPEYKHNKAQAINFASLIFFVLIAITIILVIMCEIFMPQITHIITPGLPSSELETVITMSKITFPFLLLIVIAAFCGAILTSIGSPWQFAFAPVLSNIVLIVIFSTCSINHIIASIAVLLSGVAQVIITCYGCYKKKILPNFVIYKKFSQYIRDVKIKQFLKALLGSTLSNGIMQINVFVDTIFLSFFVGGTSYLYYTDRIVQFPISIIGYSISTAVLSTFSIAIREGNFEYFKALQKQAINISLFLSIPTTIFAIVFAQEIITLIYQGQNFNHNDVNAVSIMLMIYAISIPFAVVTKVLNSTLIASKLNGRVAIINLFALIINIIINAIFFHYIKMYCVVVATAISSITSLIFTTKQCKQNNLLYYTKSNLSRYIKMSVLCIICALLAKNIINAFHFTSLNYKISSFVTLCIASLIYYATIYIRYKTEMDSLITIVRGKGN